jgi:BREX system ATP-binding protein BrxC/D
MTHPLAADEYTEFLAKEYLLEYVRTGGAAIKFCVGAPGALAGFGTRMRSAADDNNYAYSSIDAADTKVSMTDQLAFSLARTLGIGGYGRSLAQAAYHAAGFPPGDETDLRISTVASQHDIDTRELYRSVRRHLEQSVLSDHLLPRDLRLALFRLAQHDLGTGDVSDAEVEAVLNWLTGRPTRSNALRSSGIRYRITRANAHPILASLLSGTTTTGRRGLILNIDLARLGVDRPKTERDGHYYSKAARLDTYEVLRELIDTTDALHHCLVTITMPTELFDDANRGPFIYPALAMRIFDDVADRNLSNPFNPVIRVAEQ